DEEGQQVGVLLDIEEYRRLTQRSVPDTELLIGVSRAELQALADSELASSAQIRLTDLLARNEAGQLSKEEDAELDQLLEQIDQLTILKTRARYTLQHYESLTAA